MTSLVLWIACAARTGAPPTVTQPPPAATPLAVVAACDANQGAISRAADERAAPWSIAQHLAKNFPDGQVSWLMKDASYQQFVVVPGAERWGRCNDTGCYLFVAPAVVIHAAVDKSMVNGEHDPAALGKALGLPAANFEGTLRMMTLDLNQSGACARLPIDEDPGVWKCQTPQDTDCFKFGGYTSGGVPELMILNALVDQAKISTVP